MTKLTANRPFYLTDAVRPAADQAVTPTEGYRLDIYRGKPGLRIPALAAAVSRDELVRHFPESARPARRGRGRRAGNQSRQRRRPPPRPAATGIDRPVLASYFCEFEDLLLNDGCTGVAVLADRSADGGPVRRAQAAALLRPQPEAVPADPAVGRRAPAARPAAHLRRRRTCTIRGPTYACQFRDLALRLGVGGSVRKVTG